MTVPAMQSLGAEDVVTPRVVGAQARELAPRPQINRKICWEVQRDISLARIHPLNLVECQKYFDFGVEHGIASAVADELKGNRRDVNDLAERLLREAVVGCSAKTRRRPRCWSPGRSLDGSALPSAAVLKAARADSRCSSGLAASNEIFV